MRPGVTFGIMDLNQYLEKMNTTTRVIIIQISEMSCSRVWSWTRLGHNTRIQGDEMIRYPWDIRIWYSESTFEPGYRLGGCVDNVGKRRMIQGNHKDPQNHDLGLCYKHLNNVVIHRH